MPSLSQTFRLAVLPRIASLPNFAVQTEYLQVADDIKPSSNKITIGISESAISQYVLNPTPKLTLSIPIPSTNIVTACDVAQYEDEQEGRNGPLEIWCYSLQAGKTHTLNIAIKEETSESFTGSGSSAKVSLKDRVVAISVNSRDKIIVVVLKSGLIQFYDFKLALLHSLDIAYPDVGIVKFFQENSKDFLFVLCSLPDRKVCFKLFEVSLPNYTQVPIKELSSVILEDFSLADSKICYQYGKLYRLLGDEIFTYALPQCQLLQNYKLPMISSSNVVSIKPVSTNRVLLTADNKIYLLDLVYNSILFERELTHLKTFQLLKSAVINPQAPSDSIVSNERTFVIGVGTKHGANPTSSLEIANVDVGTGTLKDSIGRGFQVSSKASSHLLKPLFSDEETEFDEEDNEIERFDFERIYQKLEKSKDNLAAFDRVFLSELNIKKEHYTESDRFICDKEFLSKVVKLIFDSYQEEYPKALTFLLTHPLFPVDCTVNLLGRLRDHPRLFKQAVVTCPNLPLQELLSELFSIRNGELSLDISLRALQDYTTDTVKQEIKNLNKIDIQNFIEFIISSKDEEVIRSSHQLFQLLSLVLDSIGLFAIESELLNRLSDYIDEQVTIAERNSKLWHLLDGKQLSRGLAKTANGVSETKSQTIPKYTVEYLEL